MAKISQKPPTNLRQTGIPIADEMPWGTHFCQFYQIQQDLLDILIPYFKAGLENNEFCIWVTSEFLTKEEVLRVLKKNIPKFPKFFKSGQIEVFPYTDWYLKQGKFEMERVLEMWVAKHDEGLSRGFDGMRVSGNPFWIDNKKDWDDFASYEARINQVIGSYNLLVLCTYSLDKCHANEVIDVVTNHQFALIKRKRWEFIETAEQRQAKEVIIAQQRQLQTILDSAPALIFYKDKQNRFLQVNNACAKAMGMSKQDVEGKSAFDIYPRKQAMAFWKDDLAVIKSGKPKIGIIEPAQIKDRTRWFQTDKIPYRNEKGDIIGVIGFATDITERKTLEARKDEFISIASHELKTPVATIKAYTQILGRLFSLRDDPEPTEYLAKLEFQVDRLTELINQLLDISRIQYGKLNLIKEKFNLVDLVKDIAKDMQNITQRHSIVVEGGYQGKILADKHRISQVLINLISNAIRYSPKADQVIIKIFSDQNNVGVSVTDFGIGITPRDLSRLFERFFQAENRIRRSQGGLGLGLYLSKQIIKSHKGEIWAQSEKGKGSTFTFTLPLSLKS